MVKMLNVAGARPNFMKIALIVKEMKKYPDEIHPLLVYTGQHYDENMSKLFFEELEIPRPDIDLEIGSAPHAVQTARIMIAFEKIQNDAYMMLVVRILFSLHLTVSIFPIILYPSFRHINQVIYMCAKNFHTQDVCEKIPHQSHLLQVVSISKYQ
ncbi:UDP-N-acetylglucosamine 2-epimerase [Candidatus Vecturithrix granuli]|uniref:UDP-N-acetylglucosamine 2-epimerase n=1 Tax=Vecturithrix granuli TaxID=1499967 RepID=A0A081C4A7_VECG1|nr:UDP-N-acetylglucosamine 2-epimerase [Candidatus Vecturithrix granuli]